VTRVYIKDVRHRFSYELRPQAELDAVIRDIATWLEHDGLLEPGASTAPRFQPHLTFCRAARFVPAALHAAAEVIGRDPEVTFDGVVTFGDGRIVCLVPGERDLLDEARAALLAHLDPDELDPAVHERPWNPHITIAYAVPEHARDAAPGVVAHHLRIAGSWDRAQSWDLDVRPTALVGDVPCVPAPQDG
jgi:2'-5' RNA ligase